MVARRPAARSSARWPVGPYAWAWGAVLLSVLVCAAVIWISLEQRTGVDRTINLLDSIRQARIDIANGFLQTTLNSSDPGSSFD